MNCRKEHLYKNGTISVAVTVLDEPMEKGIVGIIMSEGFGDNIGLVLDSNPDEFDLASLQATTSGELPLIHIEHKIYEMLKSNSIEATMIIFHELGHYYNGDHKGLPKDYQEQREQCIGNKQVLPMELAADDFALGFLGRDAVIAGLEWLVKDEESKPENDTSVINELRMRLEHQRVKQ